MSLRLHFRGVTPYLKIESLLIPSVNESLLLKINPKYPISMLVSSVNLDLAPKSRLLGFYEWKGPAHLQQPTEKFVGNRLASVMSAGDFCSLAIASPGLVAKFRNVNNDTEQLVKVEVSSLQERLKPLQERLGKIELVWQPIRQLFAGACSARGDQEWIGSESS